MTSPDLWDFMLEGGYELLFPEEEEVVAVCPYCDYEIMGGETVEVADKKKKLAKCPGCGKEMKL